MLLQLVVILLTFNVWGLSEELFVLLQLFGLINRYSLRFARGVHCVVTADYIVDSYCLGFVRGVHCVVMADYIVDRYCLRFVRGVHCVATADYIVDSYC